MRTPDQAYALQCKAAQALAYSYVLYNLGRRVEALEWERYAAQLTARAATAR